MLRGLGLGFLFVIGLVGAAWAQGSARFDGQYVGRLILTKVRNGDCTKPPLGATYPLKISAGAVRFAYLPRFDTVLTGWVDESGTIRASARLRNGSIQMKGRIQGGDLKAHIVTPSCNYTFKTNY